MIMHIMWKMEIKKNILRNFLTEIKQYDLVYKGVEE